MVKNSPAMQETGVWLLGREDTMEKGMATHSSIPAWRIPWTQEPGGPQSSSVQFILVSQLCLTVCNAMDCSTPGLPVQHQPPEFTQTHVHPVSLAIQPCHPLSSSSPPAFKLSQHQSLFQWVSSSHQVAKVLEFHVQHQSFWWIFRTDFF